MSLMKEYKEISIELRRIERTDRIEQLIFLSVGFLDASLIISLIITFVLTVSG